MKWPIWPLSDLGTFKNGVNFKAAAMGSGLPVINVKDITDAHYFDADCLSLVNLDASEDSFAEPADIFFVRSSVKLDGIGLVGRLRRASERVLHCGFVIRFRPDAARIDSDYLMYLLLCPEFRQRIKGLSGGAAIINLSQGALKTLEVPLPPLGVQQEIASIIRCYDDLIESNRRRIQLLEESARLLYREWFVHLRFPGHEHVKLTQGLPTGWSRQTYDEVCHSIGGGTPSSGVGEYWDGDITWVTPSDITANDSLYLLDSSRKITESGLANSSAKMLPAEAILMTSRASIGYFALANRPVCTNQGFIAVVPKIAGSRYYLLFEMMARVEEFRSRASGSTFKELSKGTFRELPVVWPTADLLASHDNVVAPTIAQIQVLAVMNSKLKQARDLLLPRLMSGEISV